MNKIIPFDFEGTAIRSTVIDGEPWFVGNDICKILEISDARQALSKLDDDERGGCLIPTPSGEQEMRIVNESGLYCLLLRGRKAITPGTPQHRFRKWVTAEVLPTIRKTGGFNTVSTDENRVQELEEMYLELERKHLKIMEKYVEAQMDTLEEKERYERALKGVAGKVVAETNWSDDEITKILPVDEAYLLIIRTYIEKEGIQGYYERFIKK